MSDFDKWWEENYMNVSADRTEAEDIYNLGVESQQAKINDSESTRAVLYRENMDLREKIDELQSRIKQGLKIAEDLMGEMQNYKLGESLENILKGNKDEN